MQAATTYLKFIPLENLNLWDVKRYYTKNNLQFENVVTLRDILKPYKKAVSKEEMIENKWQIISKINFGGELFLRDFEEIETYKGSLNLVPDNAIIYSKINVRHGCIYFHEDGQTPFGVSSEYPTFKFDETKVNGKFLHKVLRSSAFKKLLNTKTTGISKARVKQDEFLDIEIPLPSLTEQEAIVKNYYSKIKEAEVLEKQANDLEGEIEKYLFYSLGVKIQANLQKSSLLQFVNFEGTSRWDSLFLLGKIPTLQSKYQLINFAEAIKYFNKDKKNKSIRVDSSKFPNDSFRYIGMEHIEKETGILLDMPIVNGKEIKSQTIRVPKDFFIYGKLRPYLNKYWINRTEFENIICSSEFFVFDIDESINKEFFKYVLSSKIIQDQISDKTSGARMPRINEEIFFDLKFPLPPKPIQDAITQEVSDIKSRIEQSKANAFNLSRLAVQEFEQSIFSE